MFITNRDYSRDVVDELRNKSLHFDLVTAYIALGSQEKKKPRWKNAHIKFRKMIAI